MIVVVGHVGLDANGELDRAAGLIAVAAAGAGGRVELVGAVGDDDAGERVALLLGKAGVGHAALLRDPSAPTPAGSSDAAQLPRLEREDVELGLSYIADYRVVVVAEPAGRAILDAATSAASFQGAALVAVVAPGSNGSAALPSDATVLEAPADNDGGAFWALVGRYAAALDTGSDAATAWRKAVSSTGWESVASNGG